jgi:hypothetical protein
VARPRHHKELSGAAVQVVWSGKEGDSIRAKAMIDETADPGRASILSGSIVIDELINQSAPTGGDATDQLQLEGCRF